MLNTNFSGPAAPSDGGRKSSLDPGSSRTEPSEFGSATQPSLFSGANSYTPSSAEFVARGPADTSERSFKRNRKKAPTSSAHSDTSYELREQAPTKTFVTRIVKNAAAKAFDASKSAGNRLSGAASTLGLQMGSVGSALSFSARKNFAAGKTFATRDAQKIAKNGVNALRIAGNSVGGAATAATLGACVGVAALVVCVPVGLCLPAVGGSLMAKFMAGGIGEVRHTLGASTSPEKAVADYAKQALTAVTGKRVSSRTGFAAKIAVLGGAMAGVLAGLAMSLTLIVGAALAVPFLTIFGAGWGAYSGLTHLAGDARSARVAVEERISSLAAYARDKTKKFDRFSSQ